MRIVCIADTHLQTPSVPEGDILIHAGDLTTNGGLEQISRAAQWIKSLPHNVKVIVPGNHDFGFERIPLIARSFFESRRNDTVVLIDEAAIVLGLRFYGSPWTPYFNGWAFNALREEIGARWQRIPEDTDVLVTHGPPLGIRDRTTPDGEALGCAALRNELYRVKPKLHVFGHIHGGYGTISYNETQFVNAAYCKDDGGFNAPVVIDIPKL